MPTRTTPPDPEEQHSQLLSSIASIFNEAQNHSSNHTKNCVALYKVHLELAKRTEETLKGTRLIGELDFVHHFQLQLARVLPIKKGNAPADRIMKFVGGYIKYANEKASEDQEINADDDDDDDTTTASRFTNFMLKFLLRGFLAKDKTVRYRVLNTLSEMISHLGQIKSARYDELRTSFIGRVNDKEIHVRSYAVTCLAKLWTYDSEEPTETQEGESILDILVESLAYDPSPDVRRAVLKAIPVNKHTLPAILDRSRDTDTLLRKLLYSNVLDKNVEAGEEDQPKTIGPTHPRTLTISQRELIIENGLGDREPSVRAAAAALIAKWVEVIDFKVEEKDVALEDSDGGENLGKGVLSLLELFDLKEHPKKAADALLSIFTTRVDIFNNVEFNGHYWEHLTPEKAFFARVFVEHCKNKKDEVRLEATLPVVTSIAFRIQRAYNVMLDDIVSTENMTMFQELDPAESDRREDERISRELVISELLKLAVNLDYSDEIGRRKTFQLVREMLKAEALPEALMAPCLDVLRELSNDERDLIRLVVEIVQELRDSVADVAVNEAAVFTFSDTCVIYLRHFPQEADADISFEATQATPRPPTRPLEDMSPEKIAHINQTDLRCLSMCINMLERVNGTFEENSTLDGVLKDLIIPCTNKADEVLKERAIKALGLCCLIARPLALQSLPFIINQIPKSALNIKIIFMQSLFDIIMAHEAALFKNHPNNLEATKDFLVTQIIEEQDPKLKAIACMGTAKLILSGTITDIETIKTLLKAYISPLTFGNQELRQSLTFFFSSYSHSSPINQDRMREIFIIVFLDVCEDRKAAREDEDDSELISSAQVADMFVDWTDPLQLSKAINARGVQNEITGNLCIQLDMAEDILKLLFEKDLKVEIEKADKRVLCQLLNKLHVPEIVDDYRIRSLKLLMESLRTRPPFRDSVCRTAVSKFENTITKKFQKQLEHFSEEEYRKLEQLNDLFQFLDSIIPLDDDEGLLLDAPKRGRKRRSESVVTAATDSRSPSPAVRRDNGKSKAKRPRRSAVSNDGESEDDATSGKNTPQPENSSRRNRPKRAAAAMAAKKNDQIIVISSDSEEYTENPEPKRHGKKPRGRYRPSIKTEEVQLDEDLDDLLTNKSSDSSEVPYDSIMDPSSMAPDSEEEEDEVTDLLAEV